MYENRDKDPFKESERSLASVSRDETLGALKEWKLLVVHVAEGDTDVTHKPRIDRFIEIKNRRYLAVRDKDVAGMVIAVGDSGRKFSQVGKEFRDLSSEGVELPLRWKRKVLHRRVKSREQEFMLSRIPACSLEGVA